MFKKIGILLCMMMFVANSAFAHIMNETNLYEDLSISEAADEVVLLTALGVITSQDKGRTFRPKDILTARELVAWIGSYKGIDGTTSDELAQAALADELISTIEGKATYSLVNEVLFRGALQLENPNEEITREQFAKFVASRAYQKIDGQTLLDKAGFTTGPTGVIEKVELKTKITASGEKVNIYQLTIGGKLYELGLHPQVIADSVDPLVWQGKNIAESWYGQNFLTDVIVTSIKEEQQKEISDDVVDNFALQFIVIGDTPVITQLQSGEKSQGPELSHQSESTSKAAEQLSSIVTHPVTDTSKSSSNVVGFVGIGIVLVGGLLTFGMHKRRNSLKDE